VEDWVEVFAPVVFEPHRRSAWPSEGTLVLDHLGFRSRGWDKNGRPKTGPVGFNIFAARGYENGYGQLWSLRAYPDASPESWLDFLGRLDGIPKRVITDGWSGTIKAAQLLWPEAEHSASGADTAPPGQPEADDRSAGGSGQLSPCGKPV
jgi:hypothetical protein